MLRDAGVAGQPVGVDIVELPFLFEMQKAGVEVRDAQQTMLDARQIKNPDEIMLLTQAAAMVDGVYQDIFEALKPGVRENEIVALANKRLYEMGSDQVEAINAVSGERCNPHPHNFTDRIIRPGTRPSSTSSTRSTGYRTCYYRTLAVGSSTAAPARRVHPGPRVDGRGDRPRAPRGRHRRDRPAWPAATEFGFANEMAAFGLQFGHGLGLGLHERPDHQSAQQPRATPSSCRPGWSSPWRRTARRVTAISAARIEEEVVVTDERPRRS